MENIRAPEGRPIRLLEWLIKEGDWVKYGVPLAIYRHIEDPSTVVRTKELQLRSKHVGQVKKLVLRVGQVATPGCIMIELESCGHPVVMKDMCAECGQDLRLLDNAKGDSYARVSMVPNVPELKISDQQAEELAKQDKDRLHRMRKLVLLVDLDQTLIHTTQNQAFSSMCKNNEDFYTFQLQKNEPTLYTKARPYCREFLENISEKFELQIVTFGSRQYAHKIAEFIDPKSKYFAHRILSRDECINPLKKSGNLRHLFPCGDSMVCIIDDRDDVWSSIPNLIVVKKYSYFPGAGDINSPDKMAGNKVAVESNKNDTTANPVSRKRKSDEMSPVDELSCKVMKSSDTNSCGNDLNQLETGKEPNTPSPSEETKTPENNLENIQPNSTDSSSYADTTSAIALPSNDDETIPGEKESLKKMSEFEIDTDSKDSSDSSTSSSSTSSSSTGSEKSDNSDTKNFLDNCAREIKTERNCEKHDLSNHNTADQKAGAATDITDNSITSDSKHLEENNKEQKELPTEGSSVVMKQSSDSSVDVNDKDDYLKYLQSILIQIHNTYFEAYDKHIKGDYEHSPDLRGVVPFLRSKVLYGCFIVLTGIIPNNYKASPQQHKAHVIARQLGATIDNEVTDRTTHLIGGKKGTNKYQDAQKRGNISLVSIDWLWTCSDRWEKVPEKLFPIPKYHGNSKCSSREGTPPVSKNVSFENRHTSPRRYDPVTGKLIKNLTDPRQDMVAEVARQQAAKRLQQPLYSSLQHPEVVVPVVEPIVSAEPESSNIPETSNAPASRVRSRKPSMAEMMGIGYSLSSNDISEMDKEVDDLLSSDEDNNLGSLVERVTSSSSEDSPSLQSSDKNNSMQKSDADDSSSSEEEFDHMAELLDHEMHYDEENSDLDMID